ncbi:MAG: Rid family detoxifying hydrolase [Propionibacteriaceae bacterium]|jgi:2-iminobutanoate/2-iminopropanoate deaminase|nr:Rid family detoxifying hydrolase [Propionibacteriaceae bacterium]
MVTAISTPAAPAAIGPYCQGVDTGSLVFCSGQVPIDPATGEIETDDVAAQTEQAITNLPAVLAAAGLGVGAVVKTTVFLTDIADFATVNRIYAAHFTGEVAPARSTVQVVALPKGARVEIEAIAVR